MADDRKAAEMRRLRDSLVGQFYRFTTGGNVTIYEGEIIHFCPKGDSLYKAFPAFTHTKTGSRYTVDKSEKGDRVVMRLRDGRLMAVLTSRLYDKLKRPEALSNNVDG